MKFSMISLGCSKNLVDSEMMMGILAENGFTYVEPEEAEVVIINTCGFIAPAKEESVETILETAQLKKEGKLRYLLVAGCLVQRYLKELAAELPEVDGFFGVGDFDQVLAVTKRVIDEKERVMMAGNPNNYLYHHSLPRKLGTLPGTAYVKIADGCNNRCSYCAIPMIRGDFRSRTIEDILAECQNLIEGGVKEICLIAQDSTYYGKDIYGRFALGELCSKILELPDLVWLRVLYLYPTHFEDDFIDLLANHPKMCPYVDLPLQHCQTPLLQAMNRHHSKEDLLSLVSDLRFRIPNLILRTSYIVGFPGESEDDVKALGEFMEETAFDHVGIFIYSPEEDTPAFDFPEEIDEEEKNRRRDYLMVLQQKIVIENNQKHIGKIYDILVEGQTDTGYWIGRSQGQSPDIDGLTLFKGEGKLGEVYPVLIEEIRGYDLYGSKSERDE